MSDWMFYMKKNKEKEIENIRYVKELVQIKTSVKKRTEVRKYKRIVV